MPAITICGLCQIATTQAAQFDWELNSLIGNRYVTEGIDNVPEGNAVLINDFYLGWGPLAAGVTLVQFLDVTYNEVNIFGGVGGEFGRVSWQGGVTYIDFPATDDSSTWEIGIEVMAEISPRLNVFSDAYYDFGETRGGFFSIGFASPWVVGESLTLTPYASIGIDYGYVSGPRKFKENHWDLGLILTYEIHEWITIWHPYSGVFG
ncbi:MAG: hypothetical protein LR015_12585 [Verrucomicrobia bacterium]|nr:hypothetical protein [Verrucomicrobiota bacterium]